MPDNDLTQFSILIDSIYDCAFDPEKWTSVLPDIAAYCDSDSIALDFVDLANEQFVGAFSHGFAEEFRALLIEKYAEIWMLQSGYHQWPVGMPMHLPDILPLEEFLAGAFYREWCKPQNNGGYVGMVAFRDSTRFVKMTNARLDGRGPYGEAALERFRLLTPHICKSVAISDAFRLERVRAGMLETMLDSLASGVFLVNGEGRIDYMNSAAEQQLAASPLLRMEGGALRFAERDANRKLKNALRSADRRIAEQSSGGEFLTIADGDRAGFIATVLPLSRGPERELLHTGRTAIAVFLRDPVKRPPFAAEAFAEFYKLSPAETRVAAVLSQGGNMAGVCDILGIALPTAKTHLQRIFEKTGASRQSELVAMMMATSI